MAIQTARTINPTPTPTPGSFAGVILATEPANLKGYWKCDETSGTTLADSSGNSKNLTITGAINTNYWLGETGEQGTCFRTDGVAGYASRNDAVIPSLDNTNFTLFALLQRAALIWFGRAPWRSLIRHQIILTERTWARMDLHASWFCARQQHHHWSCNCRNSV